MAFQAVPDAAEIIIEYLGNSVQQVNTLQASKAGGYNLADLVVLAVAVDAEITASWLPIQTRDVTYISTTVRGLAFANDQVTTVDTGSAQGGVLSDGLPSNATISIKRGSGLTGRSARGRIYWIGIPAVQLQPNENQLNVLDVDAIEAAVDDMRAAITATVWTAAIVSRFFESVERDPGVFFEWIETQAVNINVDSMRSRLL